MATPQQIENFARYLERDKNRFIKVIQTAAAVDAEQERQGKPSISKYKVNGLNAYEGYVAMVEQYHPQMVKEYTVAFSTAASPELLRQEIGKIKTKYGKLIAERMMAEYGDAGKIALTSVGEEMQPESFFAAPIKWVYDSKNGGAQVGGIAGLAVGLGAGFFLTGSMGWLARGAIMLGLGGALAYFGHKFIDSPSKPLELPDLSGKGKAAELARGKGKEKEGTTTYSPRVPNESPAPDPKDFGALLAANPQTDKKPSTTEVPIQDLKGLKGKLAAPTDGMAKT